MEKSRVKLQSEEGNDSICKSDDFDNQKSATVRETSPPSINEPSDCLKSVHQRFFGYIWGDVKYVF